MRLSELSPTWLVYEGKRYGIVFQCPHCFNNPAIPEARKSWLTCLVQSGINRMGDRYVDIGEPIEVSPGRVIQGGRWEGFGHIAMAVAALNRNPLDDDSNIVPCNPATTWSATPAIEEATFENISFMPSLDASNSGHWHGHITNGGIV